MPLHYFDSATDLPNFSAFTPEQLPAIIPVMEGHIQAIRELVDHLQEEANPTWENIVVPLAEEYETLAQLWGVVGHLHSVQDDPTVRESYNTLLPMMTELGTWLGQHTGICSQLKKICDSENFHTLTAAQQYALEKELLHFHLSGAGLPTDKRDDFTKIEQRLAELSAKFSENILDETKSFSYFTDDQAELNGLPVDVMTRAKERAESLDKKGWQLTLQMPDYLSVMENAENRALREHFYRHNVTRASDLDPLGNPRVHDKDNTPLIIEILKLREEKAKILDFADYTHYSLANKMAESPKKVESFLLDLAKRSRPFAEKEWDTLKRFAESQGCTELNNWDILYYSRLLREKTFAFTEEEVKPYFPAPKVIQGLLSICSRLFSIELKEEAAPVWDKNVQFYRVYREGKALGGFYADLYARDNKKSGAWMDEVLARGHYREKYHQPVAYLICNFSPPSINQPALLTMDEAITLLHELGHVLNHVLTKIDDLPITGIRGVEWDAVELPSQFMENFAWYYDVLMRFSSHVHTGEVLPRSLFNKMVTAKNFQSGLAMLRQLEFSLFDWQIHSHQQSTNSDILETLNKVRQEISVITPPPFNRFLHGFSHIFSGGYAAGYYSYKWAEVLSCDGFAKVEEQIEIESKAPPKEGGLPPMCQALSTTGQLFWKEILSVGGSRPAMESFTAFRGRAPNADALLAMNGLTTD